MRRLLAPLALAAAFLPALLAACASSYEGFLKDGTSAEKLGPGRYRVVAIGNSFTDPVVAQEFALLKCAEVTLAEQKDAFQIVKADVRQQPGAMAGTTYASRYDFEIRTVDRASVGETEFKTYDAKALWDRLSPKHIRK
ncbi:MAG: hypothetical protein JNK11_08595 [Alphaproteobacteria bacterium]|nr:hypothetical protein [Alphaproteobacteria bacterium]